MPSYDQTLRFIFMVKGPQYQKHSDDEIMRTLTGLIQDNFQTVQTLWLPAFQLEQESANVSEFNGL